MKKAKVTFELEPNQFLVFKDIISVQLVTIVDQLAMIAKELGDNKELTPDEKNNLEGYQKILNNQAAIVNIIFQSIGLAEDKKDSRIITR